MTLKQLATYNLCFNPRTREGATSAFPGENHYQLCFNPRTREGATEQAEDTYARRRFQSTHP